METHLLNATARSSTGKGAARQSRRSGNTPGVLYRAGGTATPINFDVAALAYIFRKTADPNSVVNVTIDGTVHNCLIREIQRNPLSRKVEHVDFHEVDPTDPVTVEVVINPVGRAVGTRAGGLLRVITRRLTVRATAGAIPSRLDVDVTNLDVGEFIRASEISAPDGAKVMFQRDFNVLTVEGKRTIKDEVGAPGAPAAAAAPAAAGAKAGAKPAAAAAKPAAGAAAKPAAKPAAKK